MTDCPCGQPLEIKTVMNLSLHVEVEVITCTCGKIREHYEPEPVQAQFIQKTYALMGIEVPRSVKSNEKPYDKFKLMADAL